MPRHKEFDPEKTLDDVMRLFWKKGYTITSVEDMVQNTGVSRYGLYGTFGGKHDVFLAALDRYANEVVPDKFLRSLQTENAGVREIREYFDNLLQHAKSTEGIQGCLMCNTALEAPEDEEAAVKVLAFFDILRQSFKNALSNAKETKDLPPAMDVDKYADYLVGIVQGAAVLSRSPERRSTIENYISTALENLKGY
jgi:TetR/AcrR family transcriptional repressor of nem operon